jgi:two-component system, chemotaxis family, CheB/CheR fusion protein
MSAAGTESPASDAGANGASSAAPGIVGIGASAGGLQAFVRLLQPLAPDTGLAYVLVQHLARDHESLLPELLGRATSIPVVQASDGMRIAPNHVYVIPPDVTMTVTDGHLKLETRSTERGLHLPIDAFLQSVAEVHGAGAIAVILSGAGSDGSRGVEAIKELGGIVFAQDSGSASHPSMPEAAVATGCVDFVLTPEKIAGQLAKIGKYVAQSGDLAVSVDGAAQVDELAAILKLLLRRTGVDFAQYRRATVQRRILRRMLATKKEKRADYLTLVRNDPSELDLLYRDLLIGVTSFFRDPEAFEELRTKAFPELARSRRRDAPIRVWVAGCSGGEEAYSLAIALLEYLEEAQIDAPIQLFGTDLSEAAVGRARAGVYPESIAKQVSPERLRRFFVHDRDGYAIAKSVRDLCIFSRQNITRDPPFSHLDLISCRNVLIYLEPATQRKVLSIFHYALEPHGMLLLGTAESPGTASELFEPISKRHKIYRRRDRLHGRRELEFVNYQASDLTPASAAVPRKVTVPPRPTAADVREAEIDRALVNHFGGHAVVVDEDFVVTTFRGDTSPFLAHASGSASLDVIRLARPELAMPLRVALRRAAAEHGFAREKHVSTTKEGGRQVTIEVLPMPAAAGANQSFLVLFREEPVTMPAAARQKKKAGGDKSTRGHKRAQGEAQEVESLREELASTKAYVSELVAQHAATVEELRAAGEEIQSSNEELQSTNEELETTKEEVQSTNEELTTLNEELRHRNRELGELASDLENVFASTTIPIAIVGRNFRLRRFTPATSRVMKVVPTDIGRPLGDIKLGFHLPELETLITQSVETLAVTRRLVQGDDGAYWALTIRPYRAVDRRVDGAVLVFADGAEASEERRLALEAAETARVHALRDAEALAASIAARERAEADRNAVRRQLDSAQDEERRRLSRELHDGVGQHLTALGLGLDALSNVAPPGSEVDRRAAELRALVGVLGQELHSIAVHLRPRVLDDFGLEAALSSYAKEWSKQSGIAVDIHAPAESRRLPSLVEGALYRVAQEALNNVAKHSAATHASVTVERRDGQLHVIVEDDGKGFDPKPRGRSPSSGTGLGLLGIRERLALLGGSVDIESSEGKGTTLYMRVPMSGPNGAGRNDGAPERKDG